MEKKILASGGGGGSRNTGKTTSEMQRAEEEGAGTRKEETRRKPANKSTPQWESLELPRQMRPRWAAWLAVYLVYVCVTPLLYQRQRESRSSMFSRPAISHFYSSSAQFRSSFPTVSRLCSTEELYCNRSNLWKLPAQRGNDRERS